MMLYLTLNGVQTLAHGGTHGDTYAEAVTNARDAYGNLDTWAEGYAEIVLADLAKFIADGTVPEYVTLEHWLGVDTRSAGPIVWGWTVAP